MWFPTADKLDKGDAMWQCYMLSSVAKETLNRDNWLLTCLIPAAEPVSLATGAHYLTREKSTVKFTCVLV